MYRPTMGADRDLAKTYVDAKKAQVEALNSACFSLDEYRWVRQQAYAAVGMPIVDMDFAKVIDDAMAGRSPEKPGPPHGVGPSSQLAPRSTRRWWHRTRSSSKTTPRSAYFGL